jgi:hypothetical protein
MGYDSVMEKRPNTYEFVRHDGQRGWRIPYPYCALPSSGRCVAIDPAGVTHLVNRKSLTPD